MEKPLAVELRNVTKRFGDVVAVDRVSLQIQDGDFFALLGPSGCGKTTTLRMIAGFEIPTEGEIYIQGEYMGDTPPFRRNTNMVFQNYALFPHMSVAKNIAFGLEMKRVPKREIHRRVEEALALVRLSGLGHRRPTQLSGGQQQRVALARALVNRPAVLLLDEPLGALDLKLRKEMQLELKKLQQQVGITFVYVTHDQGEALTMSNRIAVMHQGRVLQVGSPTEIYERPSCRFVADFIGESNFLGGRVVERDAETVAVEVGERLLVRAAAGPDSMLAERGQLGDLFPGRTVTLAVRPEKIRLLAEPPRGLVNCFRGRVEEVVYVGTETLFRVRLEDGSLLSVRQQNIVSTRDPGAYFGGQDTVYLAWQSESTLVLLE
jgi:spermidine/putrescine transport system ATP-binding protein